MVEHLVANERVAGSNLVSRSRDLNRGIAAMGGFFCFRASFCQAFGARLECPQLPLTEVV